jgi:predicted metal-dependent hydrolase
MRRRTIALIIGPDATLTVRAPSQTPLDYIEQLVSKKISWINRKMQEVRLCPTVPGKEFVTGESFLFLGRPYKLSFSKHTQTPLDFHGGFVIARDSQTRAKQLLIDWYKKRAREKITERVEWYSRVLGSKYRTVNITAAKKRWGSCSANGNLNFSWRLIMAPLLIVDYVVVHELVHLEEKNHSKRFWNRIRTMFPDYKDRVKWLKENVRLMLL